MADDQEIVLTATFDDRASAQIQRLQGNVRQLGTGQNAQAMNTMAQQAGGAAEGLRSLSSGFSGAITSMLGFSSIATLVPVALAGMAASFVTSGVNEFANNLNALAREAKETGADLAQYRANVDALRTAGLTDAQARDTLRRFMAAQSDLVNEASKTRDDILALYDPADRDKIAADLQALISMPTQDALLEVQRMAREFGEARGRAAEIEARALGYSAERTREYVAEQAAEAEQKWLTAMGKVNAIAHMAADAVRTVTDEERRRDRERAAATRQWELATLDLSLAWRDFKETLGSVAIPVLLPVVQGLASAMRMVANAAEWVQRIFRDLNESAPWLTRAIGSVANIPLAGIRAFAGIWGQISGLAGTISTKTSSIFQALANPPRAFADMLSSSIAAMQERWGSTIESMRTGIAGFFDNMRERASSFFGGFGEGAASGFTAMRERGAAAIESLRTGSGQLIENIRQMASGFGTAIENMRPGISSLLDNMRQGVTGFLQRFAEGVPRLAPMLDPLREFLEAPREGILRLFESTNREITAIYNAAVRVGQVILGWVPQGVKDFFAAPGEGILRLFQSTDSEVTSIYDAAVRVRDVIAGWVPQAVKDFFSGSISGLATLVTNIGTTIRNWGMDRIASWMRNPEQAFFNMVNSIADAWETVQEWTKPVGDLLAAPAQALLNLTTRIGEIINGWVIQPVIDFFRSPGQGLLNLVNNIGTAFQEWVIQPVIDFFRAPGSNILSLVNSVADRMRSLVPQPILDFFTKPLGEHLLSLIDAAKEKMKNFIPARLRSWLGIRDEEATEPIPQNVQQQLADIPREQQILVPQTTQQRLAATPREQQILLPQPAAVEEEAAVQSFSDTLAELSDLSNALRLGAPGPGRVETREGTLSPTQWGMGGLGPGPGSQMDMSQAAAALDQSVAQQVNVSGTGRIRVDVRAPNGTHVDAQAEGLFKSTEIMRQTQMWEADYGPAAATGINAGAGTMGTGGGGS